MLKNGNTSRTARRVAIVMASAGLSFAAFAPMAHAAERDGHDGRDGDGGGHHHGLFLPIGNPTPGDPAYDNCGEDGLRALHLHPLASGVVHYGVEPVAGGIDNALGGAPQGQGLEGAVHAVNCTTVVPLEDTVDYVEPAIEAGVTDAAFDAYGFAQFVCDHEFICGHAVWLP